jgi:hypothetical protein
MNQETATLLGVLGVCVVFIAGFVCMTVCECKRMRYLAGDSEDEEDEAEKPEWEHSREL